MFNGMYTGEAGQSAFGYGMEGQQSYGQEQDPYSVSYYQAAAAQYAQRSIGWDQQQETKESFPQWQQPQVQKTPTTTASPSTANFYQQPEQTPTSAPAENYESAQSMDKLTTGNIFEFATGFC